MFESDLIRMRTREGMAVAKAKGRLRGKKPKLSAAQETHLVNLHRQGTHTTSEIAELFGVARSMVYRAIQRAGKTPVATPRRPRLLPTRSSRSSERCNGSPRTG